MGRIIYSSRTVWMTEGHGRTLLFATLTISTLCIRILIQTLSHTFESVNHGNGHKCICVLFAFVFCVLCFMSASIWKSKKPRSTWSSSRVHSLQASWLRVRPTPKDEANLLVLACVFVDLCKYIYVQGHLYHKFDHKTEKKIILKLAFFST